MLILNKGDNDMEKQNQGRHLPAFILLFLAKSPGSGSVILSAMSKELPVNNTDSPAVYRALNKMEQNGYVVAKWDTTGSGPARKCYTITHKGLQQLNDFRSDIEERQKNFEFFLNETNNLNLEERLGVE